MTSMSRRPAPSPVSRPARAGAAPRRSAPPGDLPVVADAAGCVPGPGAPGDANGAVRLAATLKALADPARLRLLGLLRAQPDGEACVCTLTGVLGLSQPTVTHHLQVLHRAGFLARERRGVWVWYRVVPKTLAAVRRALA
jgi:ArsR family transcriptional regulator